MSDTPMSDPPASSRITLVVAVAENRCIGRDGDLPWHISTDLKRFKAVTMGHPMIMGRKTFRSIGRVLPGRPNIVVTRDRDFRADGVEVVHSLDAALDAARAHGTGEVMVIGGAEIFDQALPLADRLDICQVHAEVPGDTFFPEIDPAHWRETARAYHEPEQPGGPAFSFVVYDRVAKDS
ncbi:dihydrofolate reductase [Thalassospiraceae bacterium LMO-SO8]|nr:dihydrofolate reductase [Alphaproteobacteria bacterium LMO-S08]WND74674.1 dihydrofolate reductase [Thalassospiraceae bacterium LMO-SO8]